jgi:hypothetical protein
MPASIRHLKQVFARGNMPVVLFAKWPEDNLYYVVALLKLDEKKAKCLVKYEDGTECWVGRHDLHLQFNTTVYPYNEAEEIFCCLCEKGHSREPNEIILCDVCQQGYHQECHMPEIRQVEIDNSNQEWSCQTCSYIMSQLDPIAKTSTPKFKTRPKKKSPTRAVAIREVPKKQNRIKLSRDTKAKKSSSQELAKKTPPPPETETAVNRDESGGTDSAPEGTNDDSQQKLPLQELVEEVSPGDNKIIATAKALIDSIGTNDFVEAIEQKAEPKTKSTNGTKATKRKPKVAGKKSAKAPLPA